MEQFITVIMRRTYMVTVEVRPGEDGAPVEAFDRCFAQYLTATDGPFMEDYGVDAWGGYDGPRVVSANVVLIDAR